jgi:hypothetical protein
MAFFHPALLAGLALTIIPIVLHLMLRAKPKKLLFPALRLIQSRSRKNVQRLRLRHLWLLLLRMAAIALLVLAVARPTVPAADYSLSAGDWLRLLLVVGGAAGIYFGLMHFWRRKNVPRNVLVWRRSVLRGTVGAAALVLFLLLVVWPYQKRIAAAITQPALTGQEFLPVNGVMLFDTSLSMQYRLESKTRLEVAQEIAREQIGRLPAGSRIAICDTSGDAAIHFQSDLSGAANRVGALTPQPGTRTLDDRLEAALAAHEADIERVQATAPDARESALREVYVFTDLAVTAWRKDVSPRLQETLLRLPSVSIYFIDVGATTPTNVALTEILLSDQAIPRGSDLSVRVTVEAAGIEPGDRLLELHTESDSGRMEKRAQQTVRIGPDAAAAAQFSIKATGGPVVQGEVRLLASDPLEFDDVRRFTVLVQTPPEILVAAETPADAYHWIQVLAPDEMIRLGTNRYKCTYVSPRKLAEEDLKKYAVICLLNVADPTLEVWTRLGNYIEQGGGVVMILGGKVKHEAYLSPAAQRVLPAQLLARLSFNPPEYLDVKNLAHPLLKRFADLGTAELTALEINRYWRVAPAKEASVVIRYTNQNQDAAIVERAQGKGRVLLMTTPVDRQGWNELPVFWSFAALADQMMRYQSQAGQSPFNYIAGDDVTIPLDLAQPLDASLLRQPGLQQVRGDITPGTTSLTIRDADQIGNYRVMSAAAEVPFERGFTVNAPASESNLSRLTADQLDALLGKGRYSVARDIDKLQRNVAVGRLGREGFPLLMLALIAVFALEHFVANRFYDAEPQQPSV